MILSSRHPLVLVMESNCKKKISVYANMDVFIHLTTADFLKEKKEKKKKRIGSPFAFYFNKVLYRFGRWVISTTHKLKITITHLLTKQRIYVVIHRLRTFGFWMKRDQFCLILLLLVNLQILDMCLDVFIHLTTANFLKEKKKKKKKKNRVTLCFLFQ